MEHPRTDHSDDPNMLRSRTTICALRGMNAKASGDKLACFLMFWERSGLSMAKLAGAMFDTYGVDDHTAQSTVATHAVNVLEVHISSSNASSNANTELKEGQNVI